MSTKRTGDGPKSQVSGEANEKPEGARELAGQSLKGVREVRDNFMTAIDTSLAERPYTTLAMAFCAGYILARLR